MTKKAIVLILFVLFASTDLVAQNWSVGLDYYFKSRRACDWEVKSLRITTTIDRLVLTQESECNLVLSMLGLLVE
jgi:hypothetical protein